MVTFIPKSFWNLFAIGARAWPRSTSIQIKSSPLVHANSSNGTDQKTVRISSNALKLMREKIDSLAGEITAWEDVTLSTDTEGDDCVLYMTTDGRYGEQ